MDIIVALDKAVTHQVINEPSDIEKVSLLESFYAILATHLTDEAVCHRLASQDIQAHDTGIYYRIWSDTKTPLTIIEHLSNTHYINPQQVQDLLTKATPLAYLTLNFLAQTKPLPQFLQQHLSDFRSYLPDWSAPLLSTQLNGNDQTTHSADIFQSNEFNESDTQNTIDIDLDADALDDIIYSHHQTTQTTPTEINVQDNSDSTLPEAHPILTDDADGIEIDMNFDTPTALQTNEVNHANGLDEIDEFDALDEPDTDLNNDHLHDDIIIDDIDAIDDFDTDDFKEDDFKEEYFESDFQALDEFDFNDDFNSNTSDETHLLNEAQETPVNLSHHLDDSTNDGLNAKNTDAPLTSVADTLTDEMPLSHHTSTPSNHIISPNHNQTNLSQSHNTSKVDESGLPDITLNPAEYRDGQTKPTAKSNNHKNLIITIIAALLFALAVLVIWWFFFNQPSEQPTENMAQPTVTETVTDNNADKKTPVEYKTPISFNISINTSGGLDSCYAKVGDEAVKKQLFDAVQSVFGEQADSCQFSVDDTISHNLTDPDKLPGILRQLQGAAFATMSLQGNTITLTSPNEQTLQSLTNEISNISSNFDIKTEAPLQAPDVPPVSQPETLQEEMEQLPPPSENDTATTINNTPPVYESETNTNNDSYSDNNRNAPISLGELDELTSISISSEPEDGQ